MKCMLNFCVIYRIYQIMFPEGDVHGMVNIFSFQAVAAFLSKQESDSTVSDGRFEPNPKFTLFANDFLRVLEHASHAVVVLRYLEYCPQFYRSSYVSFLGCACNLHHLFHLDSSARASVQECVVLAVVDLDHAD